MKNYFSGTFNLPEDKKLPHSELVLPCTFLGDEAFALSKYTMKPYPQKNIDLMMRVFNYRLCRARRIIENSFGILASRFQIFRRELRVDPERVVEIVKCK